MKMIADREKPISKMVSCEKRHPGARMSSRRKHGVMILGFPDCGLAVSNIK